jgi:hypothetical protein
MPKTGKIWPIFSTMQNRDEAMQALKNVGVCFYLFIGMDTVDLCRAMFGSGNPSHAAINLSIGEIGVSVIGIFFLQSFKSRAAAIVLFVFALLSIIILIQVVPKAHVPITRITLIALILWSSLRAIEATIKLHGCFAARA